MVYFDVYPVYDGGASIERCAVCGGYMRRFEGRLRTCADEVCPGHAAGGVLTAAEAAARDLAAWDQWERETGQRRPGWAPGGAT